MWPVSHSISGRSSAKPRNRVIAACVWPLTRPGISAIPAASTASSPGCASTFGPSAAIFPSSQRRPTATPSSVALVTASATSPSVCESSPVGEDGVRDDLAEVLERRRRTGDDARPEAVERRHAGGGRTARENLDDLVDSGSLVEYGGPAIAAP